VKSKKSLRLRWARSQATRARERLYRSGVASARTVCGGRDAGASSVSSPCACVPFALKRAQVEKKERGERTCLFPLTATDFEARTLWSSGRPVRSFAFLAMMLSRLFQRGSWIARCSPFIALVQAVLNAQAPAAEEPAIELPTFTVQDSRVLAEPEAWRYARIEGFEVLSNASDRAATRLIEDFQRFHQALTMAWPPADVRSAVPASLILCGKGNRFDPFMPRGTAGPETGLVSLGFRDGETSAIVIDLETTNLNTVTPERLDAAVAAIAAEAGYDEVASSVLGGLPDFIVDHYRQLYREYIRFVLAQSPTQVPAWLQEGISQIFMRMEFSSTSIAIGKLEDPNTESIGGAMEDRDFNKALQGRALMPMDRLFEVKTDSTTARYPLGSLWAKQSYAFVHLCLYGNDGKYRKPLLTFLSRLNGKEPTEELFKECFGVTYRNMLMEIRTYADFTVYKSIELRAKKGERFPEPPKPEFRDATEAEVGRIKGEALRMAGNKDAARDALIAPYIRGGRDPQLLASLGMHEFAVGESGRAKKFLEAAAKAQVVRPRAYLELAQLRYADAMAAPAGAGKRLDANQVSEILKPLFVARGQPPTLPEVYETIATVWSRSEVPPTAANLDVIDEGVQRFAKRSDWVYQAALLKQQYGFLREAAVLAEIGLRAAADPAKRERFVRLKAALPPLSAPAPSPSATATDASSPAAGT